MGELISLGGNKKTSKENINLTGSVHAKRFRLVLAGIMALAMTIGLQTAIAQDDVVDAVSGVVKSVDKESIHLLLKQQTAPSTRSSGRRRRRP